MENRKSHTPVALRKQIGGTMYVVRVHFNEDAEESMKDKIKRLIEMMLGQISIRHRKKSIWKTCIYCGIISMFNKSEK